MSAPAVHASATRPAPVKGAGLRGVMTSSFLGNFVEWFDYATYSYFATVIAKVFFPTSNHTVAMIQTFGVFAISFLLRPVGALYWGSRGDRHGRKDTLAISIILMSGASFCIGLLPGYATIGLAAPAALLALRMVQGFSASGEYAGAATFLAEYTHNRKRGIVSSIVPASTAIGLLCGSALFSLESALLSEADMAAWGWRIPFLMAGPLGLIAHAIRTRLAESPAFEAMHEASEKAAVVPAAPVRDLLTRHHRPLLLSLGVSVLNAVGFYTVLTYLPTYLTDTIGFNASLAGVATTITLVAYVGFVLAAGFISDRIGRKRTMILAAALFIVLTVPTFMVLSMHSFVLVVLAELAMAATLALNDGALCSYLPETFPTQVRLSGFALSFNTANALFGGTAPLLATVLISATGSSLAPAVYVMIIAAVTLICVSRTHLYSDLGAAEPARSRSALPVRLAPGAAA